MRELNHDRDRVIKVVTTGRALATNIDVYFCDPQRPWQHGFNENTNGFLRQYFPKRIHLSV